MESGKDHHNQLLKYIDLMISGDLAGFKTCLEEKAIVDLSFPPYYIPISSAEPVDLVQLCASFGRADFLQLLQ